MLHVFASVQLGSTIIGEEINRMLRYYNKPEIKGKSLGWTKNFFLAIGLIIQIWLLAEIPTILYILFAPVFWVESLLEIYVASPGL